MDYPKVAIVYLSYHSDQYLQRMVDGIKKTTYPKDKLVLIVVDNPHPEYGSSENKINELVLPFSNNELPEVKVLSQEKNLGYAGGNNVGINWAVNNGFDYIFLHNQDGYFAPDCLEKLVFKMEENKNIGCAQSLVLLSDSEKINSAGNVFNYLGFAYVKGFGKKPEELNLKEVEEIGYASGAALMMKSSVVKEFGAFDEDLFLYHEDVEYSLRLKSAGYKVALVRDSIFFHDYVFNRNSSKFYFMERNRFAVLLMYYSTATLCLLLPIILILEVGLTIFFIMNGWFEEKIKVYRYWLQYENRKIWLDKRDRIKKIKKITDRELIEMSEGEVNFEGMENMDNPLIKYFANPLMVVYRTLVKHAILW